MFDRKWRLRCESLEQEVSRLGQEKSAMQRELDELRSWHQQSQQERNELNGVTRYQHELHGKLSRFEDSLSQTRDGVVAQAEQLNQEVAKLEQHSGIFQQTSVDRKSVV